MPDFHHILLDTDLDFLDRVSHFWDLELPLNSFTEALGLLEVRLKDAAQAGVVIQALPQEAQAAWQELLEHHGRLTVVQFSRKYGEIRVMGEAKRKREEPDLHPASPAEMLWYRALIGKSIFADEREPQEYVYVPDELVELFAKPPVESNPYTLRPAADTEHAFISLASDEILDRLAVLLCELRKDPQPAVLHKEPLPPRLTFMLALLASSGMLNVDRQVHPEKIRSLLEGTRGDSLLYCYTQWLDSLKINDLRALPGLTFEGAWTNPTLPPRRIVLDAISRVDPGTWWSIPSLIAEIKSRKPDFQRSAGDYDSWFIRRQSDDQYLRGFDAWDDVEGYLIRYLISGPLHWLGLLDLGLSAKGQPAGSFRISRLGSALLEMKAPVIAFKPNNELKITSAGHFHIPAGVSMTLLYQVGRFCHLEKETARETVYAVTAASLKRASDQELKPNQLISLLRRAGVTSLSPGMIRLLERWEKFGSEAQLEKAVLLRVDRPEILEALQKDSRAARCFGEMLTDLIVKINPGSEPTLLKVMAENGFLAEIHLDV